MTRRLLNQRKYPASQLFLLVTIGSTIALLPLAERARGPSGRILAAFGGVPLFDYLLHIPAIHAAAPVVSVVCEGRVELSALKGRTYVISDRRARFQRARRQCVLSARLRSTADQSHAR